MTEEVSAQRRAEPPAGDPASNTPQLQGALSTTASASGAGDTDPAPNVDTSSGTNAVGNHRQVSSVEIAAPAAADPLLGVVVAERYRIVELLGRGGMGIVYKVEHTRIGKLMAMKLLTGELSRNAIVVRRFKQEALTVSRLSSPNTVQVFDFGASEGLTYLVMELVAGEDLARALRRIGPMPFGRLAKIVVQACNSLAEAHRQGIVHRDVKPENIMLLEASDGREIAKVLDFGLAKLREGSELNEVTSQGAIVGTPYFMAPEQIRGDAVDQRTDIYSLGALMYRALTGHHPFAGATPMAVFTKHLTDTPLAPSLRTPQLGIPGFMSAIVMRALEKNPDDRFQRIEDLQSSLLEQFASLDTSSGRHFLDGLANLDSGAAVAAPADVATRSEVERYERKLRRLRYGYLGALGFVALGGIGAAAAALSQKPDPYKPLETEPNNSPPEANPVQLGRPISGHLGKRMTDRMGDRDFYSIDLTADASDAPVLVSISVSGLPNFSMCTLLHRQGLVTAVAQYCVGRVGRDLTIPALRLPPARYFLSVSQDMDPYGGAVPFIHENVSDLYTVAVSRVGAPKGAEVEPNDQVASANPIRPGEEVRGTIGWTRDEDVFCLPKGATDRIRWRVTDMVRDAGAVLEAAPLRGPLAGTPVRVHATKGKASRTDAVSPWVSDAQQPDEVAPACVRLRLVTDPWSAGTAMLVPNGGSELYAVEAVAD